MTMLDLNTSHCQQVSKTSCAGGHSTSLGLCPTKLPVTWEERTDHPLVPAKSWGPEPARLEGPCANIRVFLYASCSCQLMVHSAVQHASLFFSLASALALCRIRQCAHLHMVTH